MLTDKIRLGHPAIWVQNEDTARIIDLITSTVDRTYYSFRDEGFSQYVDGDWKPILIPNPVEEDVDNPYVVTYDMSVAIEYLNQTHEDKSKVTFFDNCPVDPKQYLSQKVYKFDNMLSKYREAFWKDDTSKMPMQHVVISPYELPNEYKHLISSFDDLNPTQEELIHIVNHINENANDSLIAKSEIKEVAAAGLGLTEMSFISLCLDSVVKHSKIVPSFIYKEKMKDIKNKGILEIIKPKTSFDNIGGLDNIKDIIKRTVYLRENKEQAIKYGVSPIRRILMVGVPGTGKSAICEATSKELGLDLARTGVSQVLNPYIGQSEINMRAAFRQIKAMDPLCVWIDEFGRDLSGGGTSNDSGTTDRVHGEFLTGLQELPENTFLMCAANDISGLKPEMLRADRFDKIFFVGLPAYEERKHIFSIYLSQIDTTEEYDLDSLASATQFMTGAEILSLIKETKFYVTSENLRPINTQDILNHAPTIKNTIWQKNPDMVRSMYRYAADQWDWASSLQQEESYLILGGKANRPKKQVALT